MAALIGAALDNNYPDFTWRNATPQSVSLTLTSAVTPWVPNVSNHTSNLGLVSLHHSGASVSTIIAVHSQNWASTRGASETDQAFKKGPSDFDACGFDWFERFYELPDNEFTLRFNDSATQDLRIFSAFRRDPRPLSAVVLDTGPDTAMSVEPVYVFQHQPFTNLDSQFYAGKDGPAIYEGTIRFDYDKQDVIWAVTLIRIVPIPWRPQSKVIETLEWYTSKINTRGKSYAAGLRTAPRRTISYSMYIHKDEIHVFEAIGSDAERLVAVPLWWDERTVGALSVGDNFISFDNLNSEIIAGEQLFIVEKGVAPTSELQGVTATTVSDVTLLLPVANDYVHASISSALICYVESATYEFYNQDHYMAKIVAVVDTAYDLSSDTYPQYRGIDVLTDRSIINKRLKAVLQRKKVTVGNKFSRQRNWNIENRLRGVYQHNFAKQGISQRSDLKKWLYSKDGGQTSFFVPTWQTDLLLTQDYGGSTQMSVAATGLTPNYDIQVQLVDGTIYYSQVTADVESVLTVDPIPAFTMIEVDTISVMRQVRYAKDKFNLEYTNHQVVELKTTVKVI